MSGNRRGGSNFRGCGASGILLAPGRFRMTRGALMTVLRWIIGVLARTDPGLWYLLDLRRRSALSWVPVVLLLAMLAFAVAECLIAGNVAAATIFTLLAFMLFAVKRRVSASA
jgi:hypothetical protein